MTDRSDHEVTRLLQEWGQGDQAALDQLIPRGQVALKKLAAGYLRRERPNHTLQPTALVNEAFMRGVDQKDIAWKDRAHFVAVAAKPTVVRTTSRQVRVVAARRFYFKRPGRHLISVGEKLFGQANSLVAWNIVSVRKPVVLTGIESNVMIGELAQ